MTSYRYERREAKLNSRKRRMPVHGRSVLDLERLDRPSAAIVAHKGKPRRKCPKCGEKLTRKQKICSNCGTDVGLTPSPNGVK